MIDNIRYVLAVVMIMTFPPAILYWFIIHPFVHFWRRVGPAKTYVCMAAMYLGVMWVVYLLRGQLVGIDFGTNVYLWPLALVMYASSVAIEIPRRKLLGFKMLAGLPELAPASDHNRLLTEGIYGRVRHPRYVGAALGVLAFALFTNYLGVYVLAGFSMACLYLIVIIEEKELRDRFGSRYAEYASRVPRFVPRRQTNN